MRGKLEGEAEELFKEWERTSLYRKAGKDWRTFSITQTKALGKHFKMAEQNKVLAGRGCQRVYLVEFFLAEIIQLDLVKFISGIWNWKVGCNRIFK